MAWNFRKSIKLGPVRVNLSKAGVGASIGVKGYRKGIDANGREYTHSSIPGTGIYNRTYKQKPKIDDSGLGANEYRKLNGTGKFIFILFFFGFTLFWYAGGDFWFSLIFWLITVGFSGVISNEKLYDTYERRSGTESNDDSTKRLEEELERLEALELEGNESPFFFFSLDERCSRKDLDRAFKNKIKLYQPDKLENLGPELKELGQLKSKEIIETYEKCIKILKQQKSA